VGKTAILRRLIASIVAIGGNHGSTAPSKRVQAALGKG